MLEQMQCTVWPPWARGRGWRARPSDGRAATVLFVEWWRITGSYVHGMGKGKVLSSCPLSALSLPPPPPPGFQQHPAQTILKPEVFMRPSCISKGPQLRQALVSIAIRNPAVLTGWCSSSVSSMPPPTESPPRSSYPQVPLTPIPV